MGCGRRKNNENQKINEALFQWQDLCTVNITLAIRGNPITPRLFLLPLGGREEGSEGRVKDGEKMDTKGARQGAKQTITLQRDLSNFQHVFRC